MRGRFSRAELRRLVVEVLVLRRWVFHPVLREAEQARDLAIARDAEIMTKPLSEIASDYLDAVQDWLQLVKKPMIFRAEAEMLVAQGRVDEAAHAMSLHGFAQAAEGRFYAQHGPLDRILSIRADRGVGYDLATGHAVLNAIRQARGDARRDWTLYLIAAKAFRPKMNTAQTEWFKQWRDEVLDAVTPNGRNRPAGWRPNRDLLRTTE